MGLKQKTIFGLIWTSAGTLVNGLISIIVTIVLSRVLEPYDFALIALLIVFVAVSNVLIDSGFTQAIIRDDNPSQQDLSTVFFFNFIMSIMLYAILFCLSPYIAMFFDAPELELLAKVVFLVIVFNSVSIIQNAMLNRELRFAWVAGATALSYIIGGIVSVVIAFLGFGVWAIVANMVIPPFAKSIILWIKSSWKPLFAFSFKSLKKYLHFGIFLTIQGLIDVVVTNLNSIFIGKFYTKSELGYYSQGGKMDSYVITPIVSVLQKVTYPILSKIKNDEERLKEGYRKIITMTLFTYLPIVFFVIIFSDSVIVMFLGEKWSDAGIFLKISAIGSLIYPLQKICENIVMVKGKTRQMLYMALIKQTLRVLVMLLLIYKGVLALAWGFMLTGILGGILYIYIGMKYLGYTLGEFLCDNGKIVLLSFGVSLLLYIILINIEFGGLYIIMGGIFVFCGYLFLSYLLNRDRTREWFDIIRAIRKR